MLWVYVFDLGKLWEDHLHIVEFSCNDNYHASIEMTHFEVLYYRPYRSSTG